MSNTADATLPMLTTRQADELRALVHTHLTQVSGNIVISGADVISEKGHTSLVALATRAAETPPILWHLLVSVWVHEVAPTWGIPESELPELTLLPPKEPWKPSLRWLLAVSAIMIGVVTAIWGVVGLALQPGTPGTATVIGAPSTCGNLLCTLPAQVTPDATTHMWGTETITTDITVRKGEQVDTPINVWETAHGWTTNEPTTPASVWMVIACWLVSIPAIAWARHNSPTSLKWHAIVLSAYFGATLSFLYLTLGR